MVSFAVYCFLHCHVETNILRTLLLSTSLTHSTNFWLLCNIYSVTSTSKTGHRKGHYTTKDTTLQKILYTKFQLLCLCGQLQNGSTKPTHSNNYYQYKCCPSPLQNHCRSDCGLAEWIIDDNCHVSMCFYSKRNSIDVLELVLVNRSVQPQKNTDSSPNGKNVAILVRVVIPM